MSRSPACSRKAWWCTRPIKRPMALTSRRPRSGSRAAPTAAAPAWSTPTKKSRSARLRRCQSRSATPSIPTTSSRPMGPPGRAGSGCRFRRAAPPARPASFGADALALRKAAHGALDKVSTGIERLHFNVCLAYIREFSNTLSEVLAREGRPSPDLAWAAREAVVILVQLFAPMMPHLAEESWQVLGQPGLVSEAAWPQIERDLLVEDTVTLVVQVNGKKRGEITVARNAQNPEIEAAVLALDAVKQALGGKPARKVIIVPMRIVNVVG